MSIVRSLALLNRERGTDSLGFAIAGGEIYKAADDPLKVLVRKAYRAFEKQAADSWFILGHTRFATRGAVCDRNAHPFRHGAFVGVHNGMVDAPRRFNVDSEYLWKKLAAHGGNYQTAWRNVDGCWAVAYSDGADVVLQSNGNPIASKRVGDATYFSSDSIHLAAALGCSIKATYSFSRGETWRFAPDNGDATQLPDMEHRGFDWCGWRSKSAAPLKTTTIYTAESQPLKLSDLSENIIARSKRGKRGKAQGAIRGGKYLPVSLGDTDDIMDAEIVRREEEELDRQAREQFDLDFTDYCNREGDGWSSLG